MTQLEILCKPLLLTVCNYYCAAKAGAPVNEQELQNIIRGQLTAIKLKSEENQQLKRDYARIEKALVFFIDYTIKEGQFPFSDNWLEIARSYNELSGDEKFFDLLSETLEDPEASNRIQLMHLLIGLGFDGVYRQSQEILERKMRLCATRFTQPASLDMNELYAKDPIQKHINKKRQKTTFPLLCITLCCLALSLVYNYYRFNKMTQPYRASVNKAADEALKLLSTATEHKPHTTGESPKAKNNISQDAKSKDVINTISQDAKSKDTKSAISQDAKSKDVINTISQDAKSKDTKSAISQDAKSKDAKNTHSNGAKSQDTKNANSNDTKTVLPKTDNKGETTK